MSRTAIPVSAFRTNSSGHVITANGTRGQQLFPTTSTVVQPQEITDLSQLKVGDFFRICKELTTDSPGSFEVDSKFIFKDHIYSVNEITGNNVNLSDTFLPDIIPSDINFSNLLTKVKSEDFKIFRSTNIKSLEIQYNRTRAKTAARSGGSQKHKYKGRYYKIRTGERGGKYIVVKGDKIYV